MEPETHGLVVSMISAFAFGQTCDWCPQFRSAFPYAIGGFLLGVACLILAHYAGRGVKS